MLTDEGIKQSCVTNSVTRHFVCSALHNSEISQFFPQDSLAGTKNQQGLN